MEEKKPKEGKGLKELKRLKDLGFAVKVSHLRNAKPLVTENDDKTIKTVQVLQTQVSVRAMRALGFEPESKGGTTIVRLTLPNGVEFKETVVVSKLDHYNKKLGILVGLGHLTKGQAFIAAVAAK